ncbi:MAG: AI-2E family transporter [Methanothrix sp.]|nr:MAG: AI-2E family transporter [Methanothrix sp.]
MDVSRRFDLAAGFFILLVLFVTIYLTKDFLATILLSVVLVFLLKPLYAVFYRFTKHGQVSSLFSLLIMFFLILIVLVSLTTVLLVEISNLERSGVLSDIQYATVIGDFQLWLQHLLPNWLYYYVSDFTNKYIVEIGDIPSTMAAWLLPVVENALAGIATNLPVIFAQMIVAIFFTYYILIDGKIFVSQAVELLPKTKRSLVRYFFDELNDIYTTLFTVYFTTSMLSGILAAVGFSILGVPYPFVMGAITAVFTLIPLLGPPFVFVPMSIYYLLMGNLMMSAILLVFGTVALMIIPENVIRPHLAMKNARIHPIITVLAYTAPIFVVGVIGVVVGPTLYGFLLAAYRSVLHYREL